MCRSSETGTASSGISVARQPCRKMIDHQDHQSQRFQQGVAESLHARGDRRGGIQADLISRVLRETLL